MRFEAAIRAQVAALGASRVTVSDALGDLPALKSGTVALVGIGASAMAARSAALAWRAAGLSAFAVTAPELTMGGTAGIDVVVAISESGRSVETVASLQNLGGVATVGLTNNLASPLAGEVDVAVPLGCGEDSPAYTVGYTSTLQALGLIGDHWSGRQTDWSSVPELAEAALDLNAPVVAGAAESLGQSVAIDFVAAALSEASAGEGALLLREEARVFTSAYETRSYLHGPMEALEPGTVGCVVIGDGREVQLAADIGRLGCPTLLITSLNEPAPAQHLSVARLPNAAGLAAVLLEILPVQQLAWALAEARGLADGVFRNHQDDTKLPPTWGLVLRGTGTKPRQTKRGPSLKTCWTRAISIRTSSWFKCGAPCSARSTSAVGVRAAMRPGIAAMRFARTRAATTTSPIWTNGTEGSGTA